MSDDSSNIVHLPDLSVSRKSFLKIVGREFDMEITFLVLLIFTFIIYLISIERRLKECEKKLKEQPQQ